MCMGTQEKCGKSANTASADPHREHVSLQSLQMKGTTLVYVNAQSVEAATCLQGNTAPPKYIMTENHMT